MWEQQSEFVKLLQKKRGFPETPVDLSKKDGQKFVKSLVYETMTELFEALVHLKNSKSHRATEIKEFERDEFVEELVDAQHFLIEIAIASGISEEEFRRVYTKKGEKNISRIENGY